ncbi:acyltransferase family protein [Campylobacter curvus]|uniref:acyltransferase family protein n=1 Tax=Campylobacter curvus TaxID=200 RepID=UPI00146FEDAD
MMVLIGHMLILFPESIFNNYIGFLSRGVQLFYLISGYTLYMIYHNSIKSQKDLLIYYLKRFFRIAPLFFILLPIYYYFFGLNLNYFNHSPNFSNTTHMLLHYTFLFGLFPESMTSIIPPAWSIFVEISFYILFAYIVKCIKFENKLEIITILFIIIHLLLIILSNVGYRDDIYAKTYIFFTPLYQFFIFFIGCLLFKYKHRLKANLLIIVLLSLLLPFIKYNFLNIWISVLLFSLIIIYFQSKKYKFPYFLLMVGKISYSVYLIHMLVIDIAMDTFYGIINKYILSLLILLSVLSLSSLSYGLIETKFIRFGNIFIKRLIND